MYLFDSFDVDILTNTKFSRAAILRGDACVLRSFRATNVRGSLRNWLQITFSIGGTRHRTRVEGIALGKSMELDVMKSALPCDLPSGLHTVRMTVKCSDGSTHEESWNIEVLTGDQMCTRLTHAELAAAHVPMESKMLGEFAEKATRGVDPRNRLETALALYDALLDEELPYQPVRQMTSGDHQVVRDGESTLRYGGSCADLSLLFAGLCHMKGLSPLLVMLDEHMMAGCWLTGETSSVPVIYDQKIVLELIETGSLLILDIVSACKNNGRSAEDAAEDAFNRLSKPDLPMALVDVCTALRSGVRSVSPETHISEDEFVCKNCGFREFGPEALRHSVVACPACSHPVKVPECLRIEDTVKEQDTGENAGISDEKKSAVHGDNKEKKKKQDTAETKKDEEAESTDKKDKKRSGLMRSLFSKFSRSNAEEEKVPAETEEEPEKTAGDAPSEKKKEAQKKDAPQAVKKDADETDAPRAKKKDADETDAPRAVKAETAETKDAPRTVKRAIVANGADEDAAVVEAPVKPAAPAPVIETKNADTARCMARGKYCVATGANRSATALVVPGRSQGLPVTRVEREAFKALPELVTAEIGEGVEVLGDRAFLRCAKLRTAILPETLSELGAGVFSYCSGLTEIRIPGSVKRLSRLTFQGCESLVKVVIGEGVEIIDENCFEGCSALAQIVLPESLKQIKANAFKGCTALADVRIKGQHTQQDARAFLGSGVEGRI